MDMVEVFIFDVGWIFFAAWGMALAAVSVIAFGRDIRAFTERTAARERTSVELTGLAVLVPRGFPTSY